MLIVYDIVALQHVGILVPFRDQTMAACIGRWIYYLTTGYRSIQMYHKPGQIFSPSHGRKSDETFSTGLPHKLMGSN